MTSLKQVAANRRNALKSTGPITPEGKDRSRRNAVRHGLTGETVIAAVEDDADYRAFEAAVIADYEAETAVERELLLRLASVLWRLRRATGIETALFEAVTEIKHELGYSGSTLVAEAELSDEVQLLISRRRESDAAEHDQESIMNAYLLLTALPTLPLDRLNRYEFLLWRQARQLVCTLKSLRSNRRPPCRLRFPFPLGRRDEDYPNESND